MVLPQMSFPVITKCGSLLMDVFCPKKQLKVVSTKFLFFKLAFKKIYFVLFILWKKANKMEYIIVDITRKNKIDHFHFLFLTHKSEKN